MILFGGTKKATMKKEKNDKNKSNKENNGEMEEGGKMIHPSSLEKPHEVEEKPHKWRWQGLTLYKRRRRVWA